MLLRGPPEDRHQLIIGRAVLGGNRRARLAQSVGRAMEQVRLVAPIPHLVAEAVLGERLAIFRDHVSHLLCRLLAETLLQD
nr:hypothetical protein [Rhizobium lusitanum]